MLIQNLHNTTYKIGPDATVLQADAAELISPFSRARELGKTLSNKAHSGSDAALTECDLKIVVFAVSLS